MSRATVRQAILDYFAPAGASAITGVTTVLKSWPREVWPLQIVADGALHGAVGIIVLEADSEARTALGGATSGKKRITYHCRLDLMFRSLDTTDTSGQDAMDAYDAVVDAVKALIRADRTFNNPSVVWQGGEEELSSQHGDPMLDNDTLEIWGTVRFIVAEWINS